jgi:hypothetical protein
VLPGGDWGKLWVTEFDTADHKESGEVQKAGAKVVVAARSLQVLRRA